MLVVKPAADTVAPESGWLFPSTTVPVTLPGLMGWICRVAACELCPAVTVTLSEALWYPASAAVSVDVPAGTCSVYRPSDPVIAPLPPELTDAPATGAPALLVTLPVTVPTVAADEDIWMMLPTDGTPEPFRINSM